MKAINIFVLAYWFYSCEIKQTDLHVTETKKNELNFLSEQLVNPKTDSLKRIIILKKLAKTPLNHLTRLINTDSEKYAFWINIYNAYIQITLTANPELYKDRDEFFTKKRIKIAGNIISFSDIEHGILRKSQHPYGLGYVTNFTASTLEKKLRVSQRDYRIHFALNCGALDCPPISIFKPENIEELLNRNKTSYLKKHLIYSKNLVYVPALMNWFRGDFGGVNGIRKILKKENYKITEQTKIEFLDYNWELHLNNYTL